MILLSASQAVATSGTYSLGLSMGIGAILGFAIASSIFIVLFNARLKEWTKFYNKTAKK